MNQGEQTEEGEGGWSGGGVEMKRCMKPRKIREETKERVHVLSFQTVRGDTVGSPTGSTHTHTHTQMHISTCTCTRTRTCTCIHTSKHSHMHAHTSTHTCTATHTH